MEFKHWLISEEIYQNKTAVVYHRTHMPTNIKGIIQSGFRPGEGCYHGCGLYTTYELEDQFMKNMEDAYGSYIMAYKAANLDKYLVFEINEAKKIHGANWRLSSQIPKLSKSLDKAIKLSEDITLNQIDEMQQKGGYSSEISYKLHKKFRLDQQGLKGIIYEGQNDGKCLLKYEPMNEGVDLILLRYAYATTYEGIENIQWISGTSLASARTHSLYRKQIAGKEFETGFDEKLSKKLQLIDTLSNNMFFQSDLNDFSTKELTSLTNELTDAEIFSIIIKAYDDKAVADFILRHIERELDKEAGYLLLRATSDVSLSSKNIKNLDYLINDISEREIIDDLSYFAKDKQGFIDLIIKHRKNFTSEILYRLLISARNIPETAKKISEKNLRKIARWDANWLSDFYERIKMIWPNKEIEDLLRKYATEDQKAFLREKGIDV